MRFCDGPSPIAGGSPCAGTNQDSQAEEEPCEARNCPPDRLEKQNFDFLYNFFVMIWLSLTVKAEFGFVLVLLWKCSFKLVNRS